jgi:hypothetical protein
VTTQAPPLHQSKDTFGGTNAISVLKSGQFWWTVHVSGMG